MVGQFPSNGFGEKKKVECSSALKEACQFSGQKHIKFQITPYNEEEPARTIDDKTLVLTDDMLSTHVENA